MLVCSVALRPQRNSLTAGITEVANALDNPALGVIYATLTDNPGNALDVLDAFAGQRMVEAANAAATVNASIPTTYAVAVSETATANSTQDGAKPGLPITLTGLIGWWDASVTASLSLSGSNIDSIADQSGGGQTLTWSLAKPTYSATGLNSRPAIMIASGQALQKTSFPMGTGSSMTVFFVSTVNTVVNGRTLSYGALGQSADYNNLGSWLVNSPSSTQFQFYRNSGAIPGAASASPAVHRFIITVNSSGGGALVYCDGVPASPSSSIGNWITGGSFNVGRNPFNTTELCAAPFGEIGVATGYSDATTVAQLDTYLKNKWGL